MCKRNNILPTKISENKQAVFFILMFCLIISLPGLCQKNNFVFNHITTQNGLLGSKVGCVYQDKKGFLWIATTNGLQRYDGYRFKNYTSELRNSNALQSNTIYSIFEDSKNRLWIGTANNGIYTLNRSTNQFQKYSDDIIKLSNKNGNISSIIEDGNGDIWIRGLLNIYKLNNETNIFEDYFKQFGFSPKPYVISFSVDINGNIWICTNEGTIMYEAKNKKIISRDNNPKGLEIFKTNLIPQQIIFNSNNDLWFATLHHNSIGHYKFSSNSITTYSLNEILTNNNISDVYKYEYDGNVIGLGSGNGKVYFGLNDYGICFFDDLKQGFEVISRNENISYCFHNKFSNFIGGGMLKDNQNKLWFYSFNGIDILDEKNQKFVLYATTHNNNQASLPALEVSGILQSKRDSSIYISYYHINNKSGVYQVNKNLLPAKHFCFKKNSGKNQLWNLYEDADGIIWSPNQDKTITKIDPKKGKIFEYKDTLLYGNINTIQQDNNGDTWFGFWNRGIKKIESNTKKIESYDYNLDTFLSKKINALSMFFEGDSIIWIGTNGQGLLKFNKHTHKYIKAYSYSVNNKNSISGNVVTSIVEYNKDTLFIGTDEGFNIFDRRNNSFQFLNTKYGFPTNFILKIKIDSKKNIWVITASGFCKLSLPNLQVTNYGIGDGILSYQLTNAICELFDGRILLGTSEGLIVFNPSELNRNKIPSNVSITGIKIFDKDVLFSNTEPLKLPYQSNSIKIEFSNLQFNLSDNVKYLYKLDGVDKNWIMSGVEKTAFYSQLNYGEYLFKVKCINSDGIEASEITTLKIIINTPFYKTWWFTGIVIFLVILILCTLIYWRNKKTKLIKQIELSEQELSKQLAETKMQALRSQMNPHFVFNSLNSINHFILSHDIENASNYLTKFSRLIRLILDNSRNEWTLFENEIKALELYIQLEAVRFDDAFIYSINIDKNISTKTLQIPPLIIQPYVENAIWHGLLHKQNGVGKLEINVSIIDGDLNIKITDNGVGRAKATLIKNSTTSLHKSQGMKITNERLDIANNLYKLNARVKIFDLVNDDGIPIGTSVLLIIKPKNNASDNN